MKQTMLWVAVALMTVAIVTGCNSSNDEKEPIVIPQSEPVNPEEPVTGKDTISCPAAPISLTRMESQLVSGSNDFAFNLFRQVHGDAKSQILSPISITYALGMLNNGAAGKTQQQINQVLGFGDTGSDDINAFCQKMLTEAPALDKLTKVMISNTIFTNKNYQLLPTFIEAAKTYYDAKPETRDFRDGKTMDMINQWASDHTEKMIEKMFDVQSFNPDAVSYLLNAIYFKGVWAEKFDPEETKSESFMIEGYEDGAQCQVIAEVPMMHQTKKFQYTENELCQAISLPYGNGAYTMTILLPHKDKTIDDVLGALTADSWQQCYQWLGETVLADVKLPRFETNTDIDLKSVMSALGMSNAFSDQLAEFPNFCAVPTHIGMMKQVARIKLNEEGTEAAAVTVIGMVEKSMGLEPEPRYVEFHANRPFLYVITELSTGTIFFIGQYSGL